MKLYIARHGEATFDAPSDSLRPLTSTGQAQALSQVMQHKAVLRDVFEVWVSPLVRARQTADIFLQHLEASLSVKRFLSPDTVPDLVLAKLASRTDTTPLLIVSHQPLVGALVSLLCEGHMYDSHPFVTSEIVGLEYDHIGAGQGVMISDWRPA